MKSRFPRKGWLVLLLVLGVFSVAYLSGYVHHSVTQVRLVDYITPDWSDPLATALDVEICTDRFCSSVCPTGYVAVSGRCSSSGGEQWNLLGVSPNLTSWNCFDSSLLNRANLITNPPIIVSEVMCVRFENLIPPTPPSLGNYIVEAGEVCDMNNTNGLDCTDFTVRRLNEATAEFEDVPLCNGWLTCNAAGTAFDISHCQYCNDDGVGNNIPVNNGNACNPPSRCQCLSTNPSTCGVSQVDPVCGNGVIEGGEECESPGGVINVGGIDYFCGLDCKMGAVPVGSGGSGTTCGDSVLQTGEQCEPPGSTALTGSSAICPGGYCVYEVATCQADCTWRASWPACGGGGGAGDGVGGGTCYSSGAQTLPTDI